MNEDFTIALLEFIEKYNPTYNDLFYNMYWKNHELQLRYKKGSYIVNCDGLFLSKMNKNIVFENVKTPIFLFREYDCSFKTITSYKNCILKTFPEIPNPKEQLREIITIDDKTILEMEP